MLIEAGQADLPIGVRFSSTGAFQRLGEAYRLYSVATQDVFSGEGELTLEVVSSTGTQRILLTATMDAGKDRISGTWQRRDGGVLAGQGTFAMTPVSTRPRVSDLAGNWAGDFLSNTGGPQAAASLEFDGAGLPIAASIGAQPFLPPLDSITIGVVGESLEITLESTALALRWELVGQLDPAGTVLSGSWQQFDAFAGGAALDRGDFTFQLELAAFPRGLAEVAGIWQGTVDSVTWGTTNLTLEFDANGDLVGGSFGEFGGTPADLVAGLAQLAPVYSGFAASLDDTFSQFGADSIELDGVLSPVSNLWAGSLLHYFWGSCRFSIVKL